MKIGPTFYAELQAAGLAGLPFSWGEDGLFFSASITPEQRAANGLKLIDGLFPGGDPARWESISGFYRTSFIMSGF